jgi:enoyl-CoA hydratase/carnithine racemase
MGELVDVQVTDGVATIRLDRPPRNVINVQIKARLHAAAESVGAKPAIRRRLSTVVKTCRGRRRQEMADQDYLGWLSVRRCTRRSVPWPDSKPVVAAATGPRARRRAGIALCADWVCGERRIRAADTARDHPRCRWHATAAAADQASGPRT